MMKNKKNWFLICIALAVLFSSFQLFRFKKEKENPVKAAGDFHYVRAGAAGLNNGTDWNNAWNEMDQINWSGIEAGDTVFIAGGVYGKSLNVGSSGDAALDIEIKRAIASEHGSDAGWNQAYDAQVKFINNAYIIINNRSYIFIDGVSRNEFLIESPNSGGSYPNIVSYGLNFANANNITIQNIKLDGANNRYHVRGIYILTGSGIIIKNSEFANLVNDAAMLNEVNDSLFEYNYFGPRVDVPGSCGNTPPDGCHADGFEIRHTENMIFRNNILNWSGDGLHFGIMASASGRWDIYGNIFRGIRGVESHIKMNSTGISAGPLYIYNNVFYNIGSPISSSEKFSGEARNNIFINNKYVGFGALSHDYNTFINNQGFITWGSLPFVRSVNESVSITDPFINSTGYDFRLASPTEAGYALSSPYNIDILGATRGSDGVWDIGAYEYVSAAPATPTPTPTPSYQSSDLNSDTRVNSIDFGILMSWWGSGARPKSDINQDGYVNSVDFGIMLSQWTG